MKGLSMEKGTTVRVHYVGTLDDGTQFDSSRDRGETLEFQAGTGMMIPGFDKAVMDMEVGEIRTVKIPAAEAYGEVDEKKIAKIPAANFSGAKNAPIGQRILLSGPQAAAFPAVILAVADQYVTVDLNHELAGKDLTFQIELVEIVK